MYPAQEHIDNIRQKFAEMSSKEEFLELFNYAKTLLLGDNAKPFVLKQITYYAHPKVAGKRYWHFEIKKKTGGTRNIHAPVKGLSMIQRCLNLILQCVFTPHTAATGFIPGKSIVDNAKIHAGSNYVYNIDLKDFFPSIDQARVWKCLQLKPFNLSQLVISTTNELPFYSKILVIEMARCLKDKEKADDFRRTSILVIRNFLNSNTDKNAIKHVKLLKQAFVSIARHEKNPLLFNHIDKWWKELGMHRLELADIIAALSCTEIAVERIDKEGNWQVEKRNVLPQGAATSPIITNIVCQRLDFLLTAVAKRFGLKYTRYADDITFSSMHNVYQPEGDFIKEVTRIISEQGFHIKQAKVRLQNAAYRQEVTGLVVNKAPNVHRQYIKQLRMWLYYWERYGYDRAYAYFLPDYLANKTNSVKGKPDMANVISGKLNYLRMVKGPDSKLYLKLKDRFDCLVNHSLPIDKILDIWERHGIEKAMENFYNHGK